MNKCLQQSFILNLSGSINNVLYNLDLGNCFFWSMFISKNCVNVTESFWSIHNFAVKKKLISYLPNAIWILFYSFSCGENWHDPVQCKWLKKWIKKCDDDSETSNWIAANTKVGHRFVIVKGWWFMQLSCMSWPSHSLKIYTIELHSSTVSYRSIVIILKQMDLLSLYFKYPHNYVPPALGARGGHLDLLWFPPTQKCVCIHPSV